ncbi:IS110 family transposase [Lactococcus lactis]|uniref:IS110 family transposase n=1 Tax=Lactococcus lactis TaxID=1358 RepID=UPI00191498EB|nr:IS110 family transposase [Lactococcus lactis]MBK5077765.1 IS110 family transposase [Lactococcus lactis]
MSSIIFIGMDVHKETFNLCALNGTTGEILSETRCAANAKNVHKFALRIQDQSEEEVSFKCGYEAGCLGYALYHSLTALGLECDILAPSTMLRSSKNKVIKNDKLDARMIAQNLINGTYKSVHVPDTQDVETKEYIRMVQSAKKSLKKIKQGIKALVLRHGYFYDGKPNWSLAYVKWLKKLKMPDVLREALDEYLLQYENLIERITRFEARIVEFSHNERYAEPVARLRTFKGIETASAMTIQVEISDFNRFATAKAFCAYLGLTPSEQSSGGKVNLGSISKQGNSVVRSTLIECARALLKGQIGFKSQKLKARQSGQPSSVIDYADRAIERLQRRYSRLLYSGKIKNKAVTAIARELACFIWGMSTGNIQSV